MVKIALYAYPKVYGGLMRHVELLAEGLVPNHQVTLIIPEDVQHDRASAEASLDGLVLRHDIIKGKWDWRGWFRLHHFLRQTRPDIFHVHLASPGESTLPMVASRMAGVPVTLTTEHSPSYFPLEKFYSKRVKHICQRWMDRIIALSENGRHVLVHQYGIDPQKISVVYNGVNILEKVSEEEQKKTRRKLGIRQGSTVITTISEITEKKGIGILLQVVERLIQKKIPIQILIVGEGPLKNECQSRYKSYVESRHIIFAGYQKDVRSFLSISDLFVLPSFGEEIPFAILEAMAARIPVIVTAVGGIPEIISHAESGWLVKPGDADDLASALSQIMEDNTLSRNLANRAFHLVTTRFSLSAMVEQTQEIYRSLLVEKRGTF